MIKVNFKYFKNYPSGGTGLWSTFFRLFDDDIKAAELESKIKEEINNTECGYATNKKVINIERI